MFIAVIFHSPDMPRISPLVNLWWERPFPELLRLVRPQIHADLPEDACAEFIGACFARPEVDTNRLSVCNVPYPPEWHEDGADRFAWFRALMAQVRDWQPPSVLVNMDPPFEIAQGGVVLGRWLPREE
jgi:hypothetical protein